MYTVQNMPIFCGKLCLLIRGGNTKLSLPLSADS